MTRSEYAAYRRCSKPYITKLVNEGKIHVVGGQIDQIAADAILGPPAWMSQSYPAPPKTILSHNPVVDPSSPAQQVTRPPDSAPLPARRAQPSLTETRQIHLAIKVQREDLALKRERGDLVERQGVVSAFAEAMVVIASQLDGLGGRLAIELSGMSNPAEIQALILRETRRARAAAAALLEAKINGS